MLAATPTLPITNSVSANCHSPREMKNIAAVAAAPMPRNTASSGFFSGARSAALPSSGAMIATIRIDHVVAHANLPVATGAGRPAAATFWK